MSYTTAINEVKAAVEAVSGLTYMNDGRVSSLLTEGRAEVNGRFSLYDESGPQPWPELALSPSWWFCELILEIGFEVTTDKLEQGKTLEGWARATTEALRWGSLAIATVYAWQRPEIRRDENDKRSVWIARFKMRYQE